MADGRWPMADGRWPMADGRWPMAEGVVLDGFSWNGMGFGLSGRSARLLADWPGDSAITAGAVFPLDPDDTDPLLSPEVPDVAPARKLTEPEQAARQHTRSEPLIVTKKENSAPTLTTS